MVVLGGTGFIGASLVARLVADGRRVVVLSRDARRAAATLGGDFETPHETAMAEHLASVKAVDERTVKLRALRLAKEAADAEAKAAAPPPAPKRKRS